MITRHWLAPILVLAFALAAASLLSGCAGPTEPPLPVVHSDDPTWQLVPDHLDYRDLAL